MPRLNLRLKLFGGNLRVNVFHGSLAAINVGLGAWEGGAVIGRIALTVLLYKAGDSQHDARMLDSFHVVVCSPSLDDSLRRHLSYGLQRNTLRIIICQAVSDKYVYL